jgi:hypothetical protein
VTEGTETSTWQSAADGSSDAVGGASAQQRAAAIAHDRPEVAVGAAFAGGFLLALILKRLGR